jgi:hypothetical protein
MAQERYIRPNDLTLDLRVEDVDLPLVNGAAKNRVTIAFIERRNGAVRGRNRTRTKRRTVHEIDGLFGSLFERGRRSRPTQFAHSLDYAHDAGR